MKSSDIRQWFICNAFPIATINSSPSIPPLPKELLKKKRKEKKERNKNVFFIFEVPDRQRDVRQLLVHIASKILLPPLSLMAILTISIQK